MTHFRRDLWREMAFYKSKTERPNYDKNEQMSSCYICGIRDTKSYITNHLGFYHKRLDLYNDAYEKAMNFSSTSSNPLQPIEFTNLQKKPRTIVINCDDADTQTIEPEQVNTFQAA